MKNTQVLHDLKISLVGAQLFHTDGQMNGPTDRQN